MLPQANRLVREKDFARVYRKGVTFFSRTVVLRVMPNGRKISRYGFVVSKKITKKATERNKIKRSLRENIRLKLGKLLPGYDCVLMPKKTYFFANNSEKTKDIDNVIKKAKLYK